jgi:tRNA(Ile)-lysidine synthase
VNAPRRVAVAVSGGRDSMALLHCTVRAARDVGVQVWALHVHHGLMPEADGWAAFVQRTCRRWAGRGAALQFAMRRLEGAPARGDSVEAWARAGRHAALSAMARDAGCGALMLAQHRADQAETFLLQALRGGGPAGLASMPRRAVRDGVVWLRPWLDQPREAIEAYVRRHRIGFVDDPSNADPRFVRARLRAGVMPALRAAFDGADAALAAAARRAAQAAELIDEVARGDLAAALEGERLVLARWRVLTPARRRQCLRAWLAPTGLTDAALDDLACALADGDAPARWALPGAVLQRYRGHAEVGPAFAAPDAPAVAVPAGIDREGTYGVPAVQGALRVQRAPGTAGVPLALLHGAQWAPRAGAERFQRAPRTPPRSLKKQFQLAGVGPWSRAAPLLTAADGTLLFVPGLGTDARALAAPGEPRVTLEWLDQA